MFRPGDTALGRGLPADLTARRIGFPTLFSPRRTAAERTWQNALFLHSDRLRAVGAGPLRQVPYGASKELPSATGIPPGYLHRCVLARGQNGG